MAYTTPHTWNDELVTNEQWTIELKDNFLALKDPPSQNYESNEGADYTKAGGTWANVDTDFNFSITTTGGDVWIQFMGFVSVGGTTPSIAYIDVAVDGTRIVNQAAAGLAVVLGSLAGIVGIPVTFSHMVTGLSAGIHTFNLQWATNSGIATATLYAGAGTAGYDCHPQFWVRELS